MLTIMQGGEVIHTIDIGLIFVIAALVVAVITAIIHWR